jgi:hypothetical protein
MSITFFFLILFGSGSAGLGICKEIYTLTADLGMWYCGSKSHAHARYRIAPVAVASGTADGPHLEHVGRSRSQAFDRH